MEDLIQSWNKRWRPYCLKLVFQDFHDDIKVFLKHIVFSHVEIMSFLNNPATKVTIHNTKTNQKYHIVFIQKTNSLISKETNSTSDLMYNLITWDDFFIENEENIVEKIHFNQNMHQFFTDFVGSGFSI